MISRRAASGALHIDKLVAVVNLEHKLFEQGGKLVLFYRNIDFENFRASVKAGEMMIETSPRFKLKLILPKGRKDEL